MNRRARNIYSLVAWIALCVYIAAIHVSNPQSTAIVGALPFVVGAALVLLAVHRFQRYRKQRVATAAAQRLESVGFDEVQKEMQVFAQQNPVRKKDLLFAILIVLTIFAVPIVLLTRGVPLESLQRWTLVVFVACLPLLVFVFLKMTKNTEQAYWRGIAQQFGLHYAPERVTAREPSLLLQNVANPTLRHVLSGTVDGLPFRSFQYFAYRQKGTADGAPIYSVFVFTFSGNFPHVFLDRLGLGYDDANGMKIELPNELQRKFALYAPKQYEQEALAIFTPDVLAAVADMDVPCDIEFVGNDMMIFFAQSGMTHNRYPAQLALARQVAAAFAPNLTRMRYAKIGSYVPELRPF